jgi:hypothetical protein
VPSTPPVTRSRRDDLDHALLALAPTVFSDGCRGADHVSRILLADVVARRLRGGGNRSPGCPCSSAIWSRHRSRHTGDRHARRGLPAMFAGPG